MRAELRSAVGEGLSSGSGVKVLVVDETGDIKKGDRTVGVQRHRWVTLAMLAFA